MDGRTSKTVSLPMSRALSGTDRTPGGLAFHAASLGWRGRLHLTAGEGHQTAYVESGVSEQQCSKRPRFLLPQPQKKGSIASSSFRRSKSQDWPRFKGQGLCKPVTTGRYGSLGPMRRLVMIAPLHICLGLGHIIFCSGKLSYKSGKHIHDASNVVCSQFLIIKTLPALIS